MDLTEIERYYDTVPRVAATTEEVGPFTLFLKDGSTTWDFYARPRLGEQAFTAEDVDRVLARQDELGLGRAIEWVDEVTPTLLPAVRAALGDLDGRLEECPLLVLPADHDPEATSSVRCVALAPDSPDLALAVGVVGAAFDGHEQAEPGQVGSRPAIIAEGKLVVVAAYDDSGTLVGAGTAAPRGEVTELMGIGVLPGARRQGVGAAITAALVREARTRGVRTVFLSAGSDDAASVYRALGFEQVGTACILGHG